MFIYYLSFFLVFLYPSLVSGAILTWASDIIPNFLSKSSPRDILEKEVLTSDRILMIEVKYFMSAHLYM